VQTNLALAVGAAQQNSVLGPGRDLFEQPLVVGVFVSNELAVELTLPRALAGCAFSIANYISQLFNDSKYSMTVVGRDPLPLEV